MELFWRQGYAATPLDRLVRRTGASRYGLYATFGGKRDLLLASLERYSQAVMRSEEHTSELQSRLHLVCRLLLEKKNRDFRLCRSCDARGPCGQAPRCGAIS